MLTEQVKKEKNMRTISLQHDIINTSKLKIVYFTESLCKQDILRKNDAT